MKKLFYFKTGFCLLISFFVSQMLMNEVFIAQTPVIRPDWKEHLALRWEQASSLARLSPENREAEIVTDSVAAKADQVLGSAPLQRLSQGVYAKNNEELTYTMIREGEVAWRQYEVTVKGKKLKIKLPVGEKEPSQIVLEKLYK